MTAPPARARDDGRALRGRGSQGAARARRARGRGRRPGVLFDAPLRHRPRGARRTGRATPGARRSRTACSTGAAPSTARARMVAMLAAIEALVARASARSGPIYFMSDSDGEDGFRGATLMAGPRRDRAGRDDLVGRGDQQPAASRSPTPASRPGRSPAIGRTAHPTEPEQRHQRDHEDGEARRGGRRGPARAAGGRLAVVRAARDDQRDPHPARRRLGDPGALRRGAVGALARRAPRSTEVRDAIDALPAHARARGRRGALRAQDPADGRRAGCGCGPGEVDPEHPGVKALEAAVREVDRRRAGGAASSTAAGSTPSS